MDIRTNFKLHGFSLRLDAAKHLEHLLRPLEPEEAEAWTSKILEALQKVELNTMQVDKILLNRIVKECSQDEGGDVEENVLNIIDAFDVPRLSYCEDKKKYILDEEMKKPAPSIYPGAESKANLFRMRYQLVHQRTLRHDLFAKSFAESVFKDGKKKFKVWCIEKLLGMSKQPDDIVLLGMLTQAEHGKFSLEDPTGTVTLDLSLAKFHTGLFTENCFVLVEGIYSDGLFRVSAMGFPPAESAETSRAFFGDVNFFGGPLDTCAASNRQLKVIENRHDEAMFVFLSDVWLDKAYVMERLAKLFSGYSLVPPTCFIFMGNFLFSPYGNEQSKVLKEHLKALGELLSNYPDLVESSRFLFVPGPSDPGFANIFPRPKLPDFLMEELVKMVPSAMAVSNPCRLQYCTQEIVVFREDIVTKMCRNCIYFPESGDIPRHFTKTLISQGHLTPLPLQTCPIYWDYDRSMYLYPLPDLLVIGDKFDPFTTEEMKCQVINPGSFGKNDFSFKTYVMKTREVEESQVPSDF